LTALESGKAVGRIFAARDRAAIIQLREENSAIFQQNGTRLLNAGNRNSQVVVVRERGANQFIQVLVFEDLPPGRSVSELVAAGIVGREIRVVGEGRTLVVGATAQPKESTKIQNPNTKEAPKTLKR